jgi:hypothetical protein
MTAQDWKELLTIAASEAKQERLDREIAQYHEEKRKKSGLTYKIALEYSETHPVYGKSRELKYQNFEIEGYKNAEMIFESYKLDGRKMKIEKIKLFLKETSGSFEKIRGVHFV